MSGTFQEIEKKGLFCFQEEPAFRTRFGQPDASAFTVVPQL